jgi:hypothetical protein
VSSVSNGLYFLTLRLVSVMRVIYTSKGMRQSLGCALSIKIRHFLKQDLQCDMTYTEVLLRTHDIPYSQYNCITLNFSLKFFARIPMMAVIRPNHVAMFK